MELDNLPPRIVLLVGLPASGKSTYLQTIGARALSSDEMRLLLVDDITDQTANALVFSTLRFLLRRRLEIGRPVSYVDATNLTPWERAPYLRIGRLYGCLVEAIYFDTPFEVCLERNRKRGRLVPEDVMAKMHRRMVPPTVEEGFSHVLIVRPGGPDSLFAPPERAQGKSPGEGGEQDEGSAEGGH